MDIYAALDIFAVIVSVFVYSKTKSRESLLLVWFFTITAIISGGLFFIAGEISADFSGMGVKAFIGLSLVFGLLSKSHPIVLGYIAHIAIVAMNQATALEYYSVLIYSTYAFQLLMVFHDNQNTRGHRNHLFTHTHG